MPRLGYRKSRGGCARCKQRRVKCDENTPCSACVRHGAQCSLSAGTGTPTAQSSSGEHRSGSRASSTARDESRPGRRRRQASDVTLADHDNSSPSQLLSDLSLSLSTALTPEQLSSPPADTAYHIPYFTKFPGIQNESVCPNTWITDLELMHHYATITCLTLPRAKEAIILPIWQFEIPALALEHVFLMHQVLALAALHLAHLHPERRDRYTLHASRHQNRAIAGVRLALSHINAENCHALFAASVFLLLGAYAAFPYAESESGQPTIDDVLDVFSLVRGMNEILQSSEGNIRNGSFGSLFTQSGSATSTAVIDTMHEQLKVLRQRLETTELDPATKHLVLNEVSGLLDWMHFASVTTTLPETRAVFIWPISASEDFLKLIHQRDPAALTLLAHYCVLVRSTELEYWFTVGWGSAAAAAVASSLDPAWSDAISWPLAVIGDRL